jgi:hypothetical protein
MASDLKQIDVAFERTGRADIAPLKNIYKYLLAGLAAVTLSACSKAPSCAEADSIGLVKQIYQEKYKKRLDGFSETAANPFNQWFKNAPLSVESITNDGKNSETGKQACSAELTLIVPADALSVVPKELVGAWAAWSKNVVEIKGNRFTMPVSYVLQRTEDTKVLTATLTDPSPLIEVFINFVSADLKYKSSQNPTSIDTPTVSEASSVKDTASKSVRPELASITKFIGIQPSDALGDKFVDTKLKALLTSNYAKFAENLAVASALQEEGDFVYGSGNAVQGGGSDEAGLAIHKQSGEVYAVMLVDGKDVKWFGAAATKDFPAPLRKWLANKGVSN